MFFEGDRIDAVREMILATTLTTAKPLAKLLPYQREDFTGIFKALKGLPATIRLLDPTASRIRSSRRKAAGRSRQEDGHQRREIQARVQQLA
jgi:pyruvate,orthophosphate dikinase